MAVLSLCKAFSRCFFYHLQGRPAKIWLPIPKVVQRSNMAVLAVLSRANVKSSWIRMRLLFGMQSWRWKKTYYMLYIYVCLQGAIKNTCILYTYVAYIVAFNLVKYSDLHSNNVWTAAGETASVVCFVDSSKSFHIDHVATQPPQSSSSHPVPTFCCSSCKFLRWWSFIMGSERFLSGALWNSCKASPCCDIQNRSNFIKHDCLTA